MPCTTILVGKNASYDGSTMMARNEDSPAGVFTAKKFIIVKPNEQPRKYVSVISKVTIDLPDNPMQYSAVPNAVADEGIWGEAGFNECNVAMSETETLTSNPRVLGADPLVPGGIGEEDMLTIVLPYIHSAKEGVLRLGSLLEEFGTYEMNGIGFQDENEIWWLESIGGHHWMAKRVPDDCYAVIPNQLGIDSLDLIDAYGKQENNMCCVDLRRFISENHLDLADSDPKHFDTRAAFGSHSDSDHSYNTPRAWIIHRALSLAPQDWDCNIPGHAPESDDLPWCMKPNKRITPEEVKYVLSSHFQGTKYNPYGKYGDSSERGKYRPVGINRNNFVALTQIRPYAPERIKAIQWIAMGSNPFNALVPFYARINETPEYLANTDGHVTTDSFYWANRILGALTDAHYHECFFHIERYQNAVHSKGHEFLNQFDSEFEASSDPDAFLVDCNQMISDYVRSATDDVLLKVLDAASNCMKNSFARSDA